MKPPIHPPSTPDDLLADFTDRVLDGKTAALPAAADGDLRGIEETVLRLGQAFPSDSLDEKTVRRLQADFKSRLKQDSAGSDAGRSQWQSQLTRQRFGFTFAALAIVAAVSLMLLLAQTGNGNIQGTAGLQPAGAGLLVVAVCVIIVSLWLVRRKK